MNRTDCSLVHLVSLLKESRIDARLVVEIAERTLHASFENPSEAEQALIRTAVGCLVPLSTLPTDNYWFGGPTKCNTGSGIWNKWSNALLIGCALAQDDSSEALDAVANLYKSSAEFAYGMASQDDRLISSILALFLLKGRLSSHGKLNHHIVCGHVFATIDFNYETLIDWLNSETLSARFLVVVLEDLWSGIDVWKEDLVEVQRQRKDEETMSFMPGTWVDMEQETMNDDVELKFSFVEMAGSRLVRKDMRIRKSEPLRTFVPYAVEISEEPYFSRLYDMLVRLRLRLESICSKNLGNYGKIVKLIKKFEDLVDEDAAMSE